MLKKSPLERITADEVIIHSWVSNKSNTSPLAVINSLSKELKD